MKIIYGDLLFLVNFSMDYIGLLITSRLLGRRPHGARLPIAAAIGGVFGVSSCFMTGRLYIYSLGLAVCLIMCFLSFGGGMRSLLSSSVVYVCVSALLGGLMTALFTLVGSNFQTSASSPGMALFSLVSACVFGVGSLFTRLLRRSSGGEYRDISISDRGRRVKIKALIDSGNFLCDISGRAAVIVKLKSIEKIIPKKIAVAAYSGDLSMLSSLPHRDARRVCMLFAQTPTGKKMMIGYRPDVIEIEGKTMDCVLALDISGCDYSDADGIISNKIAA